MSNTYHQWIPDILRLARDVAPDILAFRDKNLKILHKADGSPITEADLYAHQMIKSGLAALDQKIPIISEEDDRFLSKIPIQYTVYWLVDPIDGTKEFIRGSDEFTINIALIEAGRPVLGLILAPAKDHCYWATRDSAYFQEGTQASEQIHVAKDLKFPFKIVVSRSHHEKQSSKFTQILNELGSYTLRSCGSSLKMCLVARGESDLYPCFGPTFLWDTAAGQCIVEAAGGKFVDFSGKSLSYEVLTPLNNPPFLVSGCVGLLSQIVDKWADQPAD